MYMYTLIMNTVETDTITHTHTLLLFMCQCIIFNHGCVLSEICFFGAVSGLTVSYQSGPSVQNPIETVNASCSTVTIPSD